MLLNVYYAVVFLGLNDGGRPTFIEKPEYLTRLQEYLAFASVRRGLADRTVEWRLGTVRQLSGKTDQRIQICDLISNASFANFGKIGSAATKQLREAFGNYDKSLQRTETVERIESLISESSYGLALIELAETLCKDYFEPLTESRNTPAIETPVGNADRRLALPVRQKLKTLLTTALVALAQNGAATRDPQLEFLLNWVGQVIGLQRSLQLGQFVAGWILHNVCTQLKDLLAGDDAVLTIAWFKYGLNVWQLVACNNLGDIESAKTYSAALDSATHLLAGRWEHSLLLLRGLVNQSVHKVATFDFDDAARRMRSVDRFFESLSDLFGDAFPGMFPNHVKSDLRGQALGTWLQSELHAGHLDSARLDHARELNELALSEFSDPVDRSRQFQYRCQIEATANNFEMAFHFLVLLTI